MPKLIPEAIALCEKYYFAKSDDGNYRFCVGCPLVPWCHAAMPHVLDMPEVFYGHVHTPSVPRWVRGLNMRARTITP